MKSTTTILTTIISSTLIGSLHAASISLSLNQNTTAAKHTNTVNTTAQGTLDWGVFTGNAGLNITTPAHSMSGGAGFVSLVGIGGATNTTLSYSDPENLYTWTNGTPTTVGSSISLAHERWTLGADGQGARLTIEVATAGQYQLQFYTATAAVSRLSALASLNNGGNALTDTVLDATQSTVLTNYYWTVDFSTDGADTLTLDVFRASDSTSNIFAIEAFTLIPEPSAALLAGLGFLALLRRHR
jgi:hypothetical protein